MVTILHGTRETNKKVIHMRAIRVASGSFPKLGYLILVGSFANRLAGFGVSGCHMAFEVGSWDRHFHVVKCRVEKAFRLGLTVRCRV